MIERSFVDDSLKNNRCKIEKTFKITNDYKAHFFKKKKDASIFIDASLASGSQILPNTRRSMTENFRRNKKARQSAGTVVVFAQLERF